MNNFIQRCSSVFALILLASCGGGGGSTPKGAGITVTDVYPVGLAVASPTSVVASGASVVAQLSSPWRQKFGDWIEHIQQAVKQKNSSEFARAINSLVPMGIAQAAPAKILEGNNVADYIQQVLTGTVTPTVSSLPLEGFFKSYTAANCYGPQVVYSLHDDSTTSPKQSGSLPGGDVGMWLDRNGDQTTGTPCAAAQLNALMDPVKSRANASLMLGARMVALANAGTGLPTPNSSSAVTAAFQSFLETVMPLGTTADVTLAGITNNGSDSFTYQWRVSFTRGVNKQWLVVNLAHQKTSTGFTGLLQYGVSGLTSNTQATTQCSLSRKLAIAGTLRYNKSSASAIEFSSREAPYCINNQDDLTTDFAWVSKDSNNELDPTKTSASVVTGWHQDGGGFKRFATSFNPSTGAGNYLFAWQAGIGDSKSRMFAVNSNYNSSSEARDLKAFFGFAPNMATTSNVGHIGELICNWAGPSHSFTPGHKFFQSQYLTLTSTAVDWNFPTSVSTDSKIKFAPTNSCNSSSTMQFDVDAGTISGGSMSLSEGSSITNSLDSASGANSVYQEVTSRGFTLPSMY